MLSDEELAKLGVAFDSRGVPAFAALPSTFTAINRNRPGSHSRFANARTIKIIGVDDTSPTGTLQVDGL